MIQVELERFQGTSVCRQNKAFVLVARPVGASFTRPESSPHSSPKVLYIITRIIIIIIIFHRSRKTSSIYNYDLAIVVLMSSDDHNSKALL